MRFKTIVSVNILLVIMMFFVGCSGGGSNEASIGNNIEEQSISETPQPQLNNEDVKPPRPPVI